MARLNWEPSGRYETGLDRGVFYPKNVLPGPVVTENLAENPIPQGLPAHEDNIWKIVTTYYADSSIPTLETAGGPLGGIPYFRKTIIDNLHTSGAQVFVIGCNPDGVTIDPAVIGVPVVAGDILCVSIYERNSRNVTSGWAYSFWASDGQTKISVVGTTLSSGSTVDEDGWTRKWMVVKIPDGAAFVGFRDNYAAGTSEAGDTFDATALQVEKGVTTPSDFFTGDTKDGLYTYEWAGTPNASASVKRQIVGSAIPWNGLTSVDENGADSAVSYYIDGRPFLFFPKPKEFQATIKAYTYPDEFAAVMGLVEAADGMYLDSQVGDAFDLSYRTLLGDGIQGTDSGYKIHLVYNATVAPQGLAYESASNSINPTDLSWEIQAVPVRIDGYRPTAHVVIDTRHMDSDRIAKIEGLLYGDDTHAPSMPAPQTIFDLLSFGDAIIITDNGDGTWQAEGSYKNIYLIGDGVFQIDNINAVDNGDGTYTMSDGGNTTVVVS